jgi:hypothetical protein
MGFAGAVSLLWFQPSFTYVCVVAGKISDSAAEYLSLERDRLGKPNALTL